MKCNPLCDQDNIFSVSDMAFALDGLVRGGEDVPTAWVKYPSRGGGRKLMRWQLMHDFDDQIFSQGARQLMDRPRPIPRLPPYSAAYTANLSY